MEDKKYIRNPLTGRYILIGGNTYLKMKKHQKPKIKHTTVSPPISWAGAKNRLLDGDIKIGTRQN